jgi:hypothetical protein
MQEEGPPAAWKGGAFAAADSRTSVILGLCRMSVRVLKGGGTVSGSL